MKRNLEASPTEYRGVVYRSKSEAMFARYLEIAERQCDRCLVYYEPKSLLVDGWTPDFLVTEIFQSIDFGCVRVESFVIEYKPSRPTKTYIKKFVARCDVLLSRIEINHLNRPRFFIYTGSPWSEDSFAAEYYKTEDGWDLSLCKGWLDDSTRKELLATRFDLIDYSGEFS
jgi:hypothetical protein